MQHCDDPKDEGRRHEHLRYSRNPDGEKRNHRHPRPIRPPPHDMNRSPFDNNAYHHWEISPVLRQNSDLQQTLDFPLHPRYSRIDDPRLTCLRLCIRLRIQTPSESGSGESCSPTTTGRLSTPPSATTTAPSRSPLLGLAFQSLESMAFGPLGRQAGDRSPLASRRVQALLDQALATKGRRASKSQRAS
jgi:hypothetical protein